jgi:hypothetical protein
VSNTASAAAAAATAAAAARRCPSGCRVVSSSIARCGCVTRASLNAYYSGRRRGGLGLVKPVCCRASSGGGSWGSDGSTGCGWGGCPTVPGTPPPTPTPTPTPPPTPTPTQGNSLELQLYTIGACSDGGLQIVEQSLRGFLAVLPGVVGSTVQIKTGAKLQPMPVSASVVASSVQKSSGYVAAQQQQQQQQQQDGQVSAKFIFSTPRLPPQINVSTLEGVGSPIGCRGQGGW